MSEREAWLQERNDPKTGYIGASEVASVLGVSAYDSPHGVWLCKVKGESKEETLPMRRGRHMEPFIADEFTRETGISCRPSRLIRHKKWPFIAANLDREFSFNGYRCILECKDVGFFAGLQFGSDGADCVQESYLVQVAYQLIPENHDFACLCVLMDGRELRKFWYTFKPELHDVLMPGSTEKRKITAHVLDRDMASSMVKRVVQFWTTNILGGVEPPMGGTDADASYCKRERASYENGGMTNSDEEIDEECKALREHTKKLAEVESLVNQGKNRIRAFMADRKASALETTIGIFTWNTDTRGVASLRTPFRSEKA